MKPAYAVVPALLLAGFASVYVSWSSNKTREVTAEREQAAARAKQAQEDLVSGKEFVGRDGKKEAEADISRGTPKLFLYGKSRADIEERTAILNSDSEWRSIRWPAVS